MELFNFEIRFNSFTVLNIAKVGHIFIFYFMNYSIFEKVGSEFSFFNGKLR